MDILGFLGGVIKTVAASPTGQQVIGNALGVKPQTTQATAPGAVPASSNANGMPSPQTTNDTGDYSIVKMGDGGTFFFYAVLAFLGYMFLKRGGR